MKKLTFASAIAAFCLTVNSASLNAQSNVLASNTKKTETSTAKEDFFMERYFGMKESYPALTNLYGAYAASSVDKSKFMERYYAIKASYPNLKSEHDNYAACDHTMETFIKRYYAIKD